MPVSSSLKMQLAFLSLAFLTCLFAGTTPLSTREPSYVLHEKRIPHPEWQPTRRAEAHLPLPLRIGLKQQNLDSLPDHLIAVSDPSSPSYGAHWTPERLLEVFTPHERTNETVHAWLMSAGFAPERLRLSGNRAWIEVVGATVGEVEGLLDAEYHVFGHESGEEHIGCHSYSLPPHVVEHVDFIMPTVQPSIKPSLTRKKGKLSRHGTLGRHDNVLTRAVTGPLTGCDTTVTPSCLTNLYNMTYTPKATDRNTFGIVSYYSNTYLQSDLDTFFRNFSPALVGKSPTLVSIDGGSIEIDETSGVGEDGWILQYAMTLVQPQPVMLLQVGGPQTGDLTTYNEWLDTVDDSYCTSDGGDDFTYDPIIPNPFPGGLKEHSCGIIKPPYVVSNSQADHEYRFSQFYLNRQCNEFAKLGLMGVTVLYSAGNAGTSGAQSGYCINDNGSMNPNATNFNPAWPASCPWITAVGGTQVKPGVALSNSTAETVWNQEVAPGFFESGGGGFSNRFPMANYQKSAVNSYLQMLRKTSPGTLKHFNTNGRAFPDLSANANSFFDIDNGSISIDSGTSGAVPTVASIITLVNDARLAAGKKPVGFINPVIYSPAFAGAFNDIVDGTNQGCKGLQGVRDGGFKASKGWDPATGVGTPNLGVLIEKWLQLP